MEFGDPNKGSEIPAWASGSCARAKSKKAPNSNKIAVCSCGKKDPRDLEAVKPSAISNGSKVLIRLKVDENWGPIFIGFQTDENWRIHVFQPRNGNTLGVFNFVPGNDEKNVVWEPAMAN